MVERFDLDRSVPQPISQEPFAWEARQANELRRERSAQRTMKEARLVDSCRLYPQITAKDMVLIRGICHIDIGVGKRI